MDRFSKNARGLRAEWYEDITLAITAAVSLALSAGMTAALIYLLVAVGPNLEQASTWRLSKMDLAIAGKSVGVCPYRPFNSVLLEGYGAGSFVVDR